MWAYGKEGWGRVSEGVCLDAQSKSRGVQGTSLRARADGAHRHSQSDVLRASKRHPDRGHDGGEEGAEEVGSE